MIIPYTETKPRKNPLLRKEYENLPIEYYELEDRYIIKTAIDAMDSVKLLDYPPETVIHPNGIILSTKNDRLLIYRRDGTLLIIEDSFLYGIFLLVYTHAIVRDWATYNKLLNVVKEWDKELSKDEELAKVFLSKILTVLDALKLVTPILFEE